MFALLYSLRCWGWGTGWGRVEGLGGGGAGDLSVCLFQADRQTQALTLLMVPASITGPSTVQLLFLRGIRNLLTFLPPLLPASPSLYTCYLTWPSLFAKMGESRCQCWVFLNAPLGATILMSNGQTSEFRSRLKECTDACLPQQLGKQGGLFSTRTSQLHFFLHAHKINRCLCFSLPVRL